MGLIDALLRKRTKTVYIEKKSPKINWSDWDFLAAVEDGYEGNSWVYRCLQIRSEAVSDVQLKVEVFKNGEWVRDDQHILQQVLDNPCRDITRKQFLSYIVLHLDLAGNSYWRRIKAGAQNSTLELVPFLEQQHVKAKAGTIDRLVDCYIYQKDEINCENVLHLKTISPASYIIGQPLLKSAGKAIDIDLAASDSQKISMQERGISDTVFNVKEGISNEDEYEAYNKKIKDRYAKNAREPWVVGGDVEIKQLSSTPVEMDYINTRGSTREEICATCGVPVELVTGLGNANRASAETIRRTLWQDTLIPLCNNIADQLTHILCSEYSEQLRIVPDFSNVAALQTDLGEKLDNIEKLWTKGVPLNILLDRFKVGIDAVEGGDVGYLPAGLLPANFDFSADTQQQDITKAYNLTYGGKDDDNH